MAAAIAQLGERQTEDLKVPGSIPGGGSLYCRYTDFGEDLPFFPGWRQLSLSLSHSLWRNG